MKRDTRGPSAASLREIPELSPNAVLKPNPYAARIAAEGYTIRVTPGRPPKGAERAPARPRSVRFPDAVWKRLERKAKAQGVPLHAALRVAVLEWLSRTP